MKPKYFFLIILLFLISCATDNNDSGKNTNWRTGKDGLIMIFNSDNPPTEVISGQELNVIVEYANKGAYDINNLRFYLYGYDPSVLFGNPVQSIGPISVEGKSQYVPQGSQIDFVSWKTTIRSPNQADSYKQDLTIAACYHYQTIANPTLCIEPKTYTTATQKCKFTVQDLDSSQGAPIVVTSVIPKTTDNRVYLEIQFSNKGKGNPFSGSSSDNCYNNIDIKEFNSINSVRVTSPSMFFTCKPNGKTRLNNGNGFVICEAPINTNNYFITPLNIIIDYNYRQIITKTITIVNLN